MQVKVGIIGGAGYTGGELIRLLINHPNVSISFIHSRSNTNKPVSSVHLDLVGETDLIFSDNLSPLTEGSIDVLFLCVGHGEARKFLEATNVDDTIKVIDLSQDFRLYQKSTIANRQFVYGLPELNKEKIIAAKNATTQVVTDVKNSEFAQDMTDVGAQFKEVATDTTNFIAQKSTQVWDKTKATVLEIQEELAN